MLSEWKIGHATPVISNGSVLLDLERRLKELAPSLVYNYFPLPAGSGFYVYIETEGREVWGQEIPAYFDFYRPKQWVLTVEEFYYAEIKRHERDQGIKR